MILHEVMPYHPTSYLTFEPSERSRVRIAGVQRSSRRARKLLAMQP